MPSKRPIGLVVTPLNEPRPDRFSSKRAARLSDARTHGFLRPNAEDVILSRALSKQHTGFYIDVGAWDPDLDSVTKHFYLNGWRGINIEPTDLYHARLVERRPTDINLKVAVGPNRGRAQFVQHGDSGLSGLVETTERLTTFNAISDFSTRQIEVDVIPLCEITAQYAPPNVVFLKIDVEGGERGVIESAEWRAFRPRIIVVRICEARDQ